MNTITLPASPSRSEREAQPDPPLEHELIRCETAADFLAAFPRIVGFTARNSLFVVLFSGRRTCGTARIDLPRSRDPRHIDEYLDQLCGVLANLQRTHGSSAPAIVITSDESFAEAGGIPWRRFARRLDRRLARQGQRVRELCCLAPDGWASYLDPTTPLRGRPLEEIAASSLAMPQEIPSLEELGSFPKPDPDERAAVHAALRCKGSVTDAGARYAAALFEAAEPGIDEVVGIIRAANTEIGWIELFQRLTREAAPLHAHLAGGTPSEASEISMRRLRLASMRLARVGGLAPVKLKPRVYACCAISWWLRGLESVADRQVTAALRLDPENEAARVVRKLLDGTRSPVMAAA